MGLQVLGISEFNITIVILIICPFIRKLFSYEFCEFCELHGEILTIIPVLLNPEPMCQTCFFSKPSHMCQRKINPYAFYLFTFTLKGHQNVVI